MSENPIGNHSGVCTLFILYCQVLLEMPSVALTLFLTIIPVTLQTNEGEKIEGKLLGIRNAEVLIESSSGQQTLSTEVISSLEPTVVPAKRGPSVRVQLAGGSQIAAESLSSTGDNLTIQPRDQPSIDIPLKEVRSIRFRSGSAATDPSWLGWLEKDQREDLLVIRRDGERLDPQKGLITSVGESSVGFDLEGTLVDAPVERLEGVVFAGGPVSEDSGPVFIEDQFGSQWRGEQVELDEETGHLMLRLSGNLNHQIPLEQVVVVRWSSGMRLLADSEPAKSDFQTAFGTKVQADLLNALFAASQESQGDLKMHGGSTIEYRVEEGFNRFVGAVERDRDVSGQGEVGVRIELDGAEVWNGVLSDHQTQGFDIPLQKAKRLVIRVLRTEDGEFGDTIRVKRPRLLK